MKKKDIKDYKLPFKIKEGKENDREHVKEIFLKNMNHSEELRKDLWVKLYGKSFMSKIHKENKIKQAESEWKQFDEKDKEEWFDFVCKKEMTFIKDILMISNLIKIHKGNMRKVWAVLKVYGEEKKKQNDK